MNVYEGKHKDKRDAMTNERKNITQPPDWWEAFEAESEKGGVSLSEWIGDACLARLPNSIKKKLSERPPAHRPLKNRDPE